MFNKNILFLYEIYKPFKFKIIITIILNIYLATSLSARPYLLKLILNSLPDYNDGISFSEWSPIIFYILLSVINISALRVIDFLQNIKISPNMTEFISLNLFARIMNVDNVSEVLVKREQLNDSIQNIINHAFEILQIFCNRFIYLSVSLVIAVIMLSTVYVSFSLMLASWVLFLGVTMGIAIRKLLVLTERTSASSFGIQLQFIEVLKNLLSIKLYSTATHEKKLLSKAINQHKLSEVQMSKIHFWLWFVYGFSFIVLLICNFHFLLLYKQNNLISVGDFALVLTVNIILFEILWSIVKDVLQFISTLSKLKLSIDCIISVVDRVSHKALREKPYMHGAIHCCNLSFSYNTSYPILHNLNICLGKGSKVGVMGKSGSGKSTFVHLLARLLTPDSGTISINDISICAIPEAQWYSQVHIVTQNCSLFHRSIYDNITYGSVATREQVIAAAQMAKADDFIIDLPDKYNTLISDINLSGGQRQRILIARAILKGAKIMIFDEATSQIDVATEREILKGILSTFVNTTIILVTHRMEIIQMLDYALVFKDNTVTVTSSGPVANGV